MTYSIAARCPETGAFGAAIATAMPAVGALCVWTQSGVGVVCTQSWTNPYLGIGALDQMSKGQDTQAACRTVLDRDRNAARRQLGAVGAWGRGFCFTGDGCTGWCGDQHGEDFAAQGNMLTGPEVVAALASSFRASAGSPLAERLLAALEAAQRAGGDKRGRQSAALALIGSEPFRSVDLRVDDHPDPVTELRRLRHVAQAQLAPLAAHRPDADGNGAELPEDLRALVMTPPPLRPMGGGHKDP